MFSATLGFAGWCWLGVPAVPAAAAPDQEAAPDVVVIVDTSISMRERGMDPERSSLLVTKLLSDLVPGDLAVVRLLDLTDDKSLLPHRATGVQERCDEDPNAICTKVEAASDWAGDARRGKFGLLGRPSRGDAGFKQRLDAHLEQRSHNSLFYLSFRAAQGLFDEHAAAGRSGGKRAVVWLSDGRDEGVSELSPVVSELRGGGVDIRAVVFGRGDPAIPRRLGLSVDQVSSPAQMMRTFAQVFRAMVGAPYRIDNLVSANPDFDVRPDVEEMWVVVYGDDGLGEVHISGPDGNIAADYAADRQPGAGAYRVAKVQEPTPGVWRVHAEGGGPDLAYAVVQRSALGPVLLAPEAARAEERVRIVAGIRAGTRGGPVSDAQALEGARIVARIEGLELELSDAGTGADEQAGDGRFSAWHRFAKTGRVPVELHLVTPVADRTLAAQVEVSGAFRYDGPPLETDLGRLEAPGRACRQLDPPAEHTGEIPFLLDALRTIPDGHALLVRAGDSLLTPGGGARSWKAGDALEVCLDADASADSSRGGGEPWLRLRVDGGNAAHQQIELRLGWEVVGLSFWQRWGWLVLTVIAMVVVVLVALGFILPQRFPPTLAVGFVPERDDLDSYPPNQVRGWRGVGIGFYRDARAYLHPDFRLTGRAGGALAVLRAQRMATWVAPQKGLVLSRESYDGSWEPVAETGEAARLGEVYRIGESGPFFRLSVRR
jgi:hypothetical protein